MGGIGVLLGGTVLTSALMKLYPAPSKKAQDATLDVFKSKRSQLTTYGSALPHPKLPGDRASHVHAYASRASGTAASRSGSGRAGRGRRTSAHTQKQGARSKRFAQRDDLDSDSDEASMSPP